MEFNTVQTHTSVKFPELNLKNKFLITKADDKGFAQEQVDKLLQGIYLRRQLKLKPWEKDTFNNIYKSSGKSNHQILQNLKIKLHASRTINVDDLTNSNYYKENQLKTISNSQEISKQVQSYVKTKKKFKTPSTNIKTYTIQTKQICKNNMLAELMKIERENMKVKLNKYEKALKHEMKTLDKDIFTFDQHTTNEMLKNNLKNKYMNRIELNKRYIAEELKRLSQENHSLKIEIPKVLKRINDIKIYVNFVHKLFGGEPELSNCNLEDLNFQSMTANEMHNVTYMVETEMNKSKPEDNILLTLTDDELLENIHKIDVVFKIMEENILKTLAKKESLRNEIISVIEEGNNEVEYIKKKIEEREKEYKTILSEYHAEKQSGEFSYSFPDEYNEFVRKLHIELFESTKDVIISNKNDIDEYNIIDKIIKPTLKDIKDKERKIDNLFIQMENYSKQDKELFNKSVTKIKNENKILKYHMEKNNRDIQNTLKNARILGKLNKIMVTGRYKYKMPMPLHIIKKRRNKSKETKTEPTDIKLLFY